MNDQYGVSEIARGQRWWGEVTARNGEEAEIEYLHMQREHRHNRPRSTVGLPSFARQYGSLPEPLGYLARSVPGHLAFGSGRLCLNVRSTILTWWDTKITRPAIVERLNGSSFLATSISWCDCKVFILRKVSIFMTSMGYFVVIQSSASSQLKVADAGDAGNDGEVGGEDSGCTRHPRRLAFALEGG